MLSADRQRSSQWAALQQRDLKLAFFDIDGTLLGRDGRYSERVRAAIAELRRGGVKTAVASGRPRFAAQFLIDDLQLVDAGLFYTGALLYDPARAQRLALHALDRTLARRLLHAAVELDLYTEVCSEDHFYVERLTHLGRCHSEHLRVRPQECRLQDVIAAEAVVKLLFAVDRREQHALLYGLERRFPEAIFAYARMASEPDWLFASVISERACKVEGFQQLLDYHGVSADQVIAFGDAQSDMTFLSLAGVGVAMGNATDDVKAVADVQAAPVWDDGVAEVIEQWVGS